MSAEMMSNFFVHSLLRAHDWQHRPQLDDVCRWWRNGGRGVLALVGMGGAGKTAIVERFLRVLPGGLPTDPDVPKDGTLPTPHGVFVFSFYDAPNPKAFFEALQMWLEHTPRVQTVLPTGQMFYLLQQTPGLMVLDGLEKVQEDGVRGLLGRLASPMLREFLDRIAAGYFPQLSVLVTSRFPLADLRDARPQFFRSLPIEEIDLPAGVRLLRARGVNGTNLQLEGIVEACGQHALTVDFAGSYIAEFGGGDPATPVDFDMDSARLRQRLDDEPDEARRHVLKQGHRFARLAERYRDAMRGDTAERSEGDAVTLALLERICLFRLGVEAETLVNLFTGEKAVKVSGPTLAGLSRQQLQEKLDWLVRMRIVESQSDPQDPKPKIRYSIHPAVREGFLSGIGDAALRENHEAVRQGLQVSLGDAPGKNPSDSATLDLLEEIVHQTLQSGHVREAWEFYQTQIGGVDNLARRQGANDRGLRICHAFFGQTFRPSFDLRNSALILEKLRRQMESETAPLNDLSKMEQRRLIHDTARYLEGLGRILDAAFCEKIYLSGETKAHQQIITASWQRIADSKARLADLSFRGGSLIPGLSTANAAVDAAKQAGELAASYHAFTSRAILASYLGNIPLALSDFRSILSGTVRSQENEFHLRAEVAKCDLLARLGRHRSIEVLVTNWLQHATGLSSVNREKLLLQVIAASCDVFRNPKKYIEVLAHVHDIAVSRSFFDVLCYLEKTRARIAIAIRPLTEKKGASSIWNKLLLDEPFQSSQGDPFQSMSLDHYFESAGGYVIDGLAIARDCGFGIFHIDLLLERARLHLLNGAPQAALDDLRTALDDGVPGNEQTGQPELLAATHAECGYAWGIAEGLQLRGEALLLLAAQTHGQSTFAPAQRTALPAAVRDQITRAEACLTEALDRWQPLHDPEPERPDQNFHLDGKQYNYRAAETHRMLAELAGGVLTNYPLAKVRAATDAQNHHAPTNAQESTLMATTYKYDVFISYRHQEPDKSFARDLLKRLEAAGLKVAIDERDFDPVATFLEEMERCIKESRYTLAVMSPRYLESGNCAEEAIICKVLDMAERRRRIIPLVIEAVAMPVWLYNIVGISFTDTNPLVEPHAKLITKLQTP